MNNFFEELQNHYEKLLSEKNFQESWANYINFILQKQAKPYEGLPRKILKQKNNITLYRYHPIQKKLPRPAVFIIYAFINRPTILDLDSNHSFIKKLLEKNLEVYLLDWGNPLPQDKNLNMEDYLNIIHDFIPKKVNLLGICEGGILSTCYAALFPQKVQKLINMVTPLYFKENLLSRFLKNINIDLCQENIPGKFLSAGFQSLRPFRTLKMGSIDSDFFIRMEKWMNDCPDHPAKIFQEFVYHFYQRNDLSRGQYYINHKHVDLSRLKLPILNIYAKNDHLVPPHAAKILQELSGSLDYQEIEFDGGHIGVFVSQRALDTIPKVVAEFIA